MALPANPLNRSLNLRLLLFAGVTIALALMVAWPVLGLLFERHSERQLQAELERHGIALIAALRLDASQRPVIARQPSDPRFLRPASGLYWRIVAPGGELRSRSLWDAVPPLPPAAIPAGWTAFDAKGVFEERVLVVTRQVRLGTNGLQVQVEVMSDRRPVAQARAAFGRETAIFLTALWFTLALAAWVQVRMGLRPLNRVRKELVAMSGAADARLPVADHPVEIRPLTEAINAVAERRAQDIVRARQRARDLAHALKTPITALRLQIEALPTEKSREMMQGLSLISAAVEGELARTGASSEGESVDASAIVARLLAVIARTPDGARLVLRNRVPGGFLLPMGTEPALEALGAILENAARHATRTVEVLSGSAPESTWIEICDDGPGIPDDLHEVVLERGARLDEMGTSHGLGLSIAREIVTASGGNLSLGRGRRGGLAVYLEWPRMPETEQGPIRHSAK